MRKSATVLLSLAVVIVSLCSLLNAQSLTLSPTGTWTVTGAMSQARTGAAAAALNNGSVLVTGGTDANGNVSASAELYGATGAFTAVASMNVARTGHTATWLPNTSGGGYVLVTGGTDPSGVILSSAELYDPVANTWTLLPSPMVDARTGNPATVLPNSSVLLSGGTSGSATSPVVLADLEQFSLSGQQFTFAGALPTARKAHAAAALNDGRVLIAGGTDGNGNTLSSTAIYDPVAGTITNGPSLNTPRANATATTLLDGTVLIAAGSYPEGAAANGNIAELQSAEIFDPVANTITLLAVQLTHARAGHQAFLLPNNNAVLLVGGTYNGSDLASSELYTPWLGTFAATGTMSTPRSSATGAALFPLADGQLLVSGGRNQQTDASGVVTTTTSSSGELYGFATVETNQPDYSPGTPVVVTGTGWQPSEWVSLAVNSTTSGADTPPVVTTQATASGEIADSFWAPDNTDINARFYLKATGQSSGFQAQNTFTDAATVSVTVAGNGYVYGTGSSPAKWYCSYPANTPLTLSGYTYSCTPSINGGTTDDLVAVPTSGYSVGTWTLGSGVTKQSGCTAADADCDITAGSGTDTLGLSFLQSQTITVTAAAPSTAAYDSTFNVAATASSGLTVAITVSGGCSIAGGTVTMTSPSTSCVVSFNQAGNSTYAAATQIQETVTATKASQTITVGTQAPASAAYESTFPVVATSNSGLTVAITVSGGCSIAGGTVTMTSPSTSCVVSFNQAGNTDYNAATQIQETAAATKAAPTAAVTLTTGTNPSTYGVSQTFKTTMTGVSGGATPSGTVGFYNEASGATCSSLGSSTQISTTQTLSSGAASVSTTTLAAGADTILACYSGDTNYNTSSGTLAHTVDQAPSITSAASTTFTVGTAGTFTVAASGYPTSTFTETGSLPSGVTLSSAGALSGTPAAGTGGTYTITITANNTITPNATQSFTLTVDQAPSITSAASTTFTAGTAGTFTVAATGYPAPTFTETGTLPSGVTLSSTGALSGTPAAGTGGTYTITITANNTISPNATQTFTLTVDQAPAITSANKRRSRLGRRAVSR